jgi:hypothetical protein
MTLILTHASSLRQTVRGRTGTHIHVFAAYELLKKPPEPTELEPWEILITLVEWGPEDLD